MSNLDNIVVGKPLVTGGILVAPIGSTLPTDEKSALDAAFVATGYSTDDGLTQSESRDTDTIFGWGGVPLAVVQKSTTVTFKFGLAEFLNALTQKLIYGDSNVVAAAGSSTSGATLAISITSAPCPHKVWVFEMSPGTDQKVRVVVPDGQITETDDVSYKDDGIAARIVTMTAFPDADGVFAYIYTNDGVKVVD